MSCEAGDGVGGGGTGDIDCFAWVYLKLYSDERRGNVPAAQIDARRDALIKQFNASVSGRDFNSQMRRLITRVEELSATEPSQADIAARAEACAIPGTL